MRKSHEIKPDKTEQKDYIQGIYNNTSADKVNEICEDIDKTQLKFTPEPH